MCGCSGCVMGRRVLCGWVGAAAVGGRYGLAAQSGVARHETVCAGSSCVVQVCWGGCGEEAVDRWSSLGLGVVKGVCWHTCTYLVQVCVGFCCLLGGRCGPVAQSRVATVWCRCWVAVSRCVWAMALDVLGQRVSSRRGVGRAGAGDWRVAGSPVV